MKPTTLCFVVTDTQILLGRKKRGFGADKMNGFGGKRDITVARHAPRFVPPRPAAWRPPHAGPRQALVIGAGLAPRLTFH